MRERKTGLDKFVGKNVWVLVNHNIHKLDCSLSWIKILSEDEVSYTVHEAKATYFLKESNGRPWSFRYGDRLKKRILTNNVTYNRKDVAIIEPMGDYVCTTDELFEKYV